MKANFPYLQVNGPRKRHLNSHCYYVQWQRKDRVNTAIKWQDRACHWAHSLSQLGYLMLPDYLHAHRQPHPPGNISHHFTVHWKYIYMKERSRKKISFSVHTAVPFEFIESVAQHSAPPALLVKSQTRRNALAGFCHPSPLQINRIFFTYNRWLCGSHSALVIHSYLPAFMSHGSFTLVTET